jgi:hypothetical protein
MRGNALLGNRIGMGQVIRFRLHGKVRPFKAG